MPITILRPDAVDTAFTDAVAANTGTDHGAVSDQSDATYVRRSAASGAAPMVVFDVPTTAIAATQMIVGLTASVRGKSVSNQVTCRPQVIQATGVTRTVNADAVIPAGTSAIGTYESSLLPFGVLEPHDPTSIPWSQAGIDALRIQLRDGALYTDANRAYIYETWLNVYTLTRPVAYISSPSGTVTDKGAPPVVLDVSNIVETWQTTQPGYDVFLPGGSVEVKIFTEAQAVAAGFDPTTDTPLWSTTKAYALSYIDGVATSTCPTITCDTTQLENDVSYRAYARASIEGTAQTDPWGAWAHSAFALDLDTVAAPSIAVVAEDSVGRIEISAGGSGDKTGHTLPTLSVERSADEGATWIPVRGLTEVVLPSLTAMAVAYDYEAPRGVELTYRARTTTTYAGSRVSSPWATDTVTAALSGWNLKAPQEPTLNAIGLHVTGDVSEEYVEQVSVQRPMNRPRPVVLTAAIAGADLPADGSFTFITTGDAEWLAVRPALRYQGPLFFESPYGWAKWVRLLTRSAPQSGATAQPRRRVSVTYVECDPAPEA